MNRKRTSSTIQGSSGRHLRLSHNSKYESADLKCIEAQEVSDKTRTTLSATFLWDSRMSENTAFAISALPSKSQTKSEAFVQTNVFSVCASRDSSWKESRISAMSSVWRSPPLPILNSARSRADTVSENNFGTAGQRYSERVQSELFPCIFYEREGLECRAFDLPISGFELWKPGIAIVLSRNERKPDLVGHSGIEKRPVNLRTADYENLGLPF